MTLAFHPISSNNSILSMVFVKGTRDASILATQIEVQLILKSHVTTTGVCFMAQIINSAHVKAVLNQLSG